MYARAVLISAFSLCLAGCEQVFWLHPIAEGANEIRDSDLVGRWVSDDFSDDGALVIDEEGDHYRVQLPNGGGKQPLIFKARLVSSSGALFFDLVEQDGGLPHHNFWRLEWRQERLEIELLSESYLLDLLKSRSDLPHELVRDSPDDRLFVITAAPERIREFLAAAPPAAWTDRTTLRRAE